jgi:calcium-dependent protein kinase
VASKTNIKDVYIFGKFLGKGGFGMVKLGYLKSNKDKKVAIKIIDKKHLKKKTYLLLRELETIKSLDHPNIIKFYEVY